MNLRDFSVLAIVLRRRLSTFGFIKGIRRHELRKFYSAPFLMVPQKPHNVSTPVHLPLTQACFRGKTL